MLWSYFIFALVVTVVSGQNSAPAILNHVDEGEVCKNLTDMTDQQSPIDIQLSELQLVKLTAANRFKFNNNYNRAIEGKLENIGHTFVTVVSGQNSAPAILNHVDEGEVCKNLTDMTDQQSPIDIQLSELQLVKLTAANRFKFNNNYNRAIEGKLENIGHTFVTVVSGQNSAPAILNHVDEGEVCKNLTDMTDQQSPIDIQLSELQLVKLTAANRFKFNNNYNRAIEGKLENIGHTLKFTPNDKSPNVEVEGGDLGGKYRFLQYHLHWSQKSGEGSEHSIAGLYYDAELHLVHYGLDAQGNATNKLAVLGIFLKVDRGDGTPTSNISRALRIEEQAIRNPSTFKKQEGVKQILADKLPSDRNCFIRYMGSLTTEPCTEGVIWTHFAQPLLISPAQMAELRALVDNSPKPQLISRNYRQVQDHKNRTVKFFC